MRLLKLPTQGRLCGIDYGTVRIGVAICDVEQNFVSPLETYCRQNEKRDAEHFQRLAKQEDLVGWVVGLPIHCDGKESPKSLECRSFGEWLAEITGLPFTFYDERYSSKEARQLMLDTGWSPKKKKKNLDRLAAFLILSHFLQATRAQTGSLSQNQPIEDATFD